jgi:hypothetical protein
MYTYVNQMHHHEAYWTRNKSEDTTHFKEIIANNQFFKGNNIYKPKTKVAWTIFYKRSRWVQTERWKRFILIQFDVVKVISNTD